MMTASDSLYTLSWVYHELKDINSQLGILQCVI